MTALNALTLRRTRTRRAGKTRRGPLSGIRAWLGSRPGLGRNVAAVFVLIILGIGAGAVIISQEALILPWQHKTTIYAVFSDASAIAPGQHQEVRIAGVHVGQIAGSSVTSGGQAKIQMQITDTSSPIYANAKALLQAKTPLNEMYVSISPGGPPAKRLTSGESIPVAQTQSPVEIDQILQHLGPNQQNAQRILLSETNIALTNASGAIANDLTSLRSGSIALQPVATALATRQGEIKTLVTDMNLIAVAIGGNDARLAALITNAQTTLTTLSNNNTSLQQTLAALPGTTDALGTSLGKVTALSKQLNPFLDNVRAASTVMPTALTRLNQTLVDLKPTIDAVNPLITVATPVVDSSKALLSDANPALSNLTQISPLLNPITAYLGYDTPWLQGFFFHTASLGSVYVDTPAGREQVVRAVVGTGTSALQTPLGPLLSTLCPSLKNSPGGLPPAVNPVQVLAGSCPP